MNETPTVVDDETWIRRAIELAGEARARGDQPFGSLVVAPDGSVVAEGRNSLETDDDITGHAETNLVRATWKRRHEFDLSTCTLYTSTEPCAMCSGAIYWAGIGRVVYGLSEAGLAELTGADPKNPTMALPSEVVLNSGQHDVEVVGPVLADEAAVVHDGFWTFQ